MIKCRTYLQARSVVTETCNRIEHRSEILNFTPGDAIDLDDIAKQLQEKRIFKLLQIELQCQTLYLKAKNAWEDQIENEAVDAIGGHVFIYFMGSYDWILHNILC